MTDALWLRDGTEVASTLGSTFDALWLGGSLLAVGMMAYSALDAAQGRERAPSNAQATGRPRSATWKETM